jgi:hypothetical protein
MSTGSIVGEALSTLSVGSSIANQLANIYGYDTKTDTSRIFTLGGTGKRGTGLISGQYNDPEEMKSTNTYKKLNSFGKTSTIIGNVLGDISGGGAALAPMIKDGSTTNPKKKKKDAFGNVLEDSPNADPAKGYQMGSGLVSGTDINPADNNFVATFGDNSAGPGGDSGLRKGGKNEEGAVPVEAEGGEHKIHYDEGYNIINDGLINGKSHEHGGKKIVLKPNEAVLNKGQYAMLQNGIPLKSILDGLKNVNKTGMAAEGTVNDAGWWDDVMKGDKETVDVVDPQKNPAWGNFLREAWNNTPFPALIASPVRSFQDFFWKDPKKVDFQLDTPFPKKGETTTMKSNNFKITKSNPGLGNDVDRMIANKHARDFFSGKTKTIFPIDPSDRAKFESDKLTDVTRMKSPDVMMKGDHSLTHEQLSGLIAHTQDNLYRPIDKTDTTDPNKSKWLNADNLALLANTAANLGSLFQPDPKKVTMVASTISEPTFVTPHQLSPESYLKESGKQTARALIMAREAGAKEAIPSILNAGNEQVGKIGETVAGENVKENVAAQSQNAQASNQIKQTNAGLLTDASKTNAGLNLEYQDRLAAVRDQRNKAVGNLIMGGSDWYEKKRKRQIEDAMLARIMSQT